MIVEINKTKYSTYDIYIGITNNLLLITPCEDSRYLYNTNCRADNGNSNIPSLTKSTSYRNLGQCFSFTDIQSVHFNKGMMGAIKCDITLKNGSYFKLLLPKIGGIGTGMPHHSEYRDILIEKLKEY